MFIKKIVNNKFWPKIILGLVILNFLVFPMVVAAEDTPTQLGPLERLTKVGSKFSKIDAGTPSLPATIGGIIRYILSLVGAVFMAYLIYAGWLWLIAAGNEEKLTKAKTIIRGTIIGLIIVLAAYLITTTVINRVISATGYKETTGGSGTVLKEFKVE